MAADRQAGWLEMALSWRVVRRGLLFSVVVGWILVTINHGDSILRGEVDSTRLLRIALTVATPYIVSTISSVSALRDRATE